MKIEKQAGGAAAFRRPALPFANARSAFRALLEAAGFEPGDRVLLPAYIGWSPREGSGVFDPVAELGLDPCFYRVDERLDLDLGDFERQLRDNRVRVAVLIHYFGRVDPRCAEAARLARRHGALVLEDEAHALLTDLVAGGGGRMGDACIFSLHKMLPVESGGMLVLNPGAAELADRIPAGADAAAEPWEFDLFELARLRRRNAALLAELLRPLRGEVDPLWEEVPADAVLQTFPVLVRSVSRDRLYFAMNEAGFGVVSLYHTLIDRLPRDDFPASHFLARHVMNLPVHQDAEPEQLAAMVDRLAELVRPGVLAG